MVIMALDHTRAYLHYGSIMGDPTDLSTTTPFLFFTRFITHFCAPVFVFLAGTSANLFGSKKTKGELFRFLFSRGLWIILLEVVINNFIWWFDPTYSFLNFQVLWAIGASMIVLSLVIYLPLIVQIILGSIIVAGHNLLDGITMEGSSPLSLVWYALHQQNFVPLGESRLMAFYYPLLPWIGLMILGYCLGYLYRKGFDADVRRKWLLGLGAGAVIAFILIRSLNSYGEMMPWSYQKDIVYTLLSFLKLSKYPPSLLYILVTIGPSLLFLYATDKSSGSLTNFFLVYGRVPLFYYFAHMILIHSIAILGLWISGKNIETMIITSQTFAQGPVSFEGYGYSLWIVYSVWIGVVLLLYPVSKAYMQYKSSNKDKWWLSYL